MSQPIVQALTLMTASGFAFACLYINLVEQPARLPIAPAALLAQWRVSYHRGTAMQLLLAILAAALAVWSYGITRDWRWLAGAGCLLTIAPYTLAAVMPVNRQLLAIPEANTDGKVATLVRLWGWRHAVRGILGLTAAFIFCWASA